MSTETKTLTTLRADELQPGDVVRLLLGAVCSVTETRACGDDRRLVMVWHATGPNSFQVTGVWLWKYSRVEVLSDVKGRGHLVTPMQVSVTESVSMEAPETPSERER